MTTKLPDDVRAKYIRAGKIAREVKTETKNFVRENMPLIEICEKAEELIRKKKGQPAFPCNVSVNEVAAHYTSPPNDRNVVTPNSLVKVDVGVHLDGYIADTAITICFNTQHENLVRAAEEALKVATKTIHAGISTSKLGAAIQKTIKGYGCKPVSNLTGHQIGRYLIHTGKSIPNVSHLIGSKIRENDVIALEPFVTVAEAAGKVENRSEVTIFRFVRRKSLKNKYAKRLLEHIERRFATLPFAERWIKGVILEEEHYLDAFRLLLKSKCLMSYPVFVETSGKPVAQAEHTVIVSKTGCEVLT